MNILRQSYSVIKKKYAKFGKGNVRLTQSDLVLILPINPASANYNFIVLQNDTTVPQTAQEIRLNMNDEFIATDMGVFLLGQLQGDPASNVSTKWHTHVPTEVNRTFVEMEEFYNGRVNISVNKISFLENWHIKKHQVIPRTQWQNTSAGQPFATIPSEDFKGDGMYIMQPMITFSGAKKNEVNLTLPRAISPHTVDFTATDGLAQVYTINRIAVVFRGLLAQNAAAFQSSGRVIRKGLASK
jgi:hypothetical protein